MSLYIFILTFLSIYISLYALIYVLLNQERKTSLWSHAWQLYNNMFEILLKFMNNFFP